MGPALPNAGSLLPPGLAGMLRVPAFSLACCPFLLWPGAPPLENAYTPHPSPSMSLILGACLWTVCREPHTCLVASCHSFGKHNC